jgi:hypothetical protein
MSVVQPSVPMVDARGGPAGTRIDLDDVCRLDRLDDTTVKIRRHTVSFASKYRGWSR